MNPIMVRVELCMGKLLAERDLSPRAKRNLSRGVGVGVSCIVLLAVLYLLIYMIVPQIIESLNKSCSTRRRLSITTSSCASGS